MRRTSSSSVTLIEKKFTTTRQIEKIITSLQVALTPLDSIEENDKVLYERAEEGVEEDWERFETGSYKRFSSNIVLVTSPKDDDETN